MDLGGVFNDIHHDRVFDTGGTLWLPKGNMGKISPYLITTKGNKE